MKSRSIVATAIAPYQNGILPRRGRDGAPEKGQRKQCRAAPRGRTDKTPMSVAAKKAATTKDRCRAPQKRPGQHKTMSRGPKRPRRRITNVSRPQKKTRRQRIDVACPQEGPRQNKTMSHGPKRPCRQNTNVAASKKNPRRRRSWNAAEPAASPCPFLDAVTNQKRIIISGNRVVISQKATLNIFLK